MNKKNLLISYLPPDELETLLKLADVVKFKAHETIIAQGETVKGMYVITKGKASSHVKLMGEGTAEVEKYDGGNFLGEISFIECVPSPRSIVAIDECHCLFINRTLFNYLATYHPRLKFHLLNVVASQISDRLNRIYEKIEEFITNSDMVTQLTFIGKMIESLNTPEKITLNDIGLSAEELHLFAPFNTLTMPELELLLQHSSLLKVPKNCKLIYATKKPMLIYIVIFGAARSTIEVDKKVAKLSVIGPGRLFACPSLVSVLVKAAIVFSSCEKMITLQMNKDNIEYIRHTNPELWYKVFDLVCHSLAALEKSVYKLDVRLNSETYNR